MIKIVEGRLKVYYQDIICKSVTISEDGEVFPGGIEFAMRDVTRMEILIRDKKFFIALIMNNGEYHAVDEKRYDSLDEAMEAANEWSRYLRGEETERLGKIEYIYKKADANPHD